MISSIPLSPVFAFVRTPEDMKYWRLDYIFVEGKNVGTNDRVEIEYDPADPEYSPNPWINDWDTYYRNYLINNRSWNDEYTLTFIEEGPFGWGNQGSKTVHPYTYIGPWKTANTTGPYFAKGYHLSAIHDYPGEVRQVYALFTTGSVQEEEELEDEIQFWWDYMVWWHAQPGPIPQGNYYSQFVKVGEYYRVNEDGVTPYVEDN